MKSLVFQTLLVLCLVPLLTALTHKIEPRSEECIFVEATESGIPITVIFQVTAGGQLDIDAMIYDPRGQIVQSFVATSDGRHHFTSTAAGNYKVCFSNTMARWTPKWVSFYVTTGHSTNTAKLEHLDPIEKTIIHLTQGLSDLQEEQKLLRAVEKLHRDTIEATNTRILYWSCFEAVILVVMGLFQIYYLKSFLEVKSSI